MRARRRRRIRDGPYRDRGAASYRAAISTFRLMSYGAIMRAYPDYEAQDATLQNRAPEKRTQHSRDRPAGDSTLGWGRVTPNPPGDGTITIRPAAGLFLGFT
jgi:hypothetical protein